MALENKWIGYFDRSYQQVKTAVLQKIGIEVPEMSDHTESNPFIIIINVFMALYEMLNYYIDNVAREIYLHSARQYRSAQKIAKLFGYRLKLYNSASTLVRFSIGAAQVTDIEIPLGTILDAEGIKFQTSQTLIIEAGQLTVEGIAVQKEIITTSFISDGSAGQRFLLEENTVDKSVTVSVNSVSYEFVEHLYDAIATDKVFTTEVTADRTIELVFGNGIDGFVPILNDVINVIFSVSEGELGNVATSTVNIIDSIIVTPTPLSVTNISQATGGYGLENLEDLKKKIPAYNRTLNRAVTEKDYKDIAESHSGVAKAFVAYSCGAEVDIYIVPIGTGLATQILLDGVKDLFYEETRLILIDVNPLPAGRINAKLTIRLVVLDVYNRTATINRVKANLVAFFDAGNQEISGSVFIGDIYQVIENTEGVSNSEVILLSTIPEATITSGATNLNWTRNLSPSSTSTVRWQIKYIGGVNYELRKGSTFLGTLAIGQIVNQPEVVFTVLAGAYILGDTWTFTTYPYSGTIQLDEPSIVSILPENINLIATGGV